MRIQRFKEILNPKAFKDLMKFMQGQTADEEGIYEDDFMKWFYKRENTD